MFIHTLESLEEFEDYIKQLEETVGLSTETYQEVTKAISKERDKLKNLSLSGVSKSVVCGYCNDTGWDSYPNHDTTLRPCPECQP